MPVRVKFKRRYDLKDHFRNAYRVTLFLPNGRYPRGTFCSPTGILHADEDVVFAATLDAPWHVVGDDLPYSEADWLLPASVRLLGSLMLTERFTDRRCAFYPLPRSELVLDEKALDLRSPEAAAAIKLAMLSDKSDATWTKTLAHVLRIRSTLPFQLFDPYELEINEYQRFWLSIDPSNFVLMRAIQSLIKADMLAAHHEFIEESAIACFIALDASFELVLRHLRASGIAKPSAHDAGEWLYRTFDEPLGVGLSDMRYFGEFYIQRIRTIHPGSRYGDTPFAAVAYDDYIHLRQALPQILAYLVLGAHTPRFAEEIEARTGS